MSRIPPLATKTTPELAPLLEQAERAMGYLPQRRAEIMPLARAALESGRVGSYRAAKR